jgi:hypothetical protein
MQSWAFSRNGNFNCIDCKNPVADAMGFFLMSYQAIQAPSISLTLTLSTKLFISC